MDCHLVDFNFEEEENEESALTLGALDKAEVNSCAIPTSSDKSLLGQRDKTAKGFKTQ